MEEIYNAAYNGSKNFTQQEVYTANATGFGAAADDYAERGIDLNEQLIYNKPATFFFRMNGDAMLDAGIQKGDILIVDRSIPTQSGKIIVASVNGDLVIRRFIKTYNKALLVAENKSFANIELQETTQYSCWGVVTCVIHILEKVLLDTDLKKRRDILKMKAAAKQHH